MRTCNSYSRYNIRSRVARTITIVTRSSREASRVYNSIYSYTRYATAVLKNITYFIYRRGVSATALARVYYIRVPARVGTAPAAAAVAAARTRLNDVERRLANQNTG